MSLTHEAAGGRVTLGLALLSFAAGSTDAIAFLALENVFTSAMSGNTVLLGVAIGRGDFDAALHSFAALFGFMTGVSLASLAFAKSGRGSGWALGLEASFLAVFAALWLWVDDPVRSPGVYGFIVISAVAMGLQGGIGRKIGVPGIMTVIFTSTYTAIVSDLIERTLTGRRPLLTTLAAQQLTTLVVYLASAVVGGVVATHWFRAAPLMPLAAVMVVLGGRLLHLFRFDPQRP
ncbi:DUF1275 domain-containing protein [Verticiella sediminum]|uniref:DUF1275 domain-containing protein n=1 Tax=Verticiella sediminum TaxID=1247510 RepID=A0A556AXD1_9BURK|nr:YoaK family protein [Verticiella sediminum]TSH97085.1 DUF1275 domain-containing protein [Verticiella sediminum]